MEWGIVMAFPMVFGMLLLVFGHSAEADYQTFGRTVLNAPRPETTKPTDLRKAA